MRAIRILAVLTALALLLSGCGSNSGPISGSPVALYYLNRSPMEEDADAVVGREQRFLETEGLEDLLKIYFAGPNTETLLSPFPPNTALISADQEDGVQTLKLSGPFFTLSGVEMSAACCCLASTVCEYENRDEILIIDETERVRISVWPDSFLLSASIQDEVPETYTVYFPDSSHRYLMQETRDAILSRNESEAAFLMRKLLEGPRSQQLESVFPEGTQVRSLKVADSICTVDLSEEFLENRPTDLYQNYTTIYSIVNTLTGIKDLAAVQFLVEGRPVDAYGIFPLRDPVTRNIDCLGPVRTTGGEVDVDIYVLGEDGETEFPVPCRVKQTTSEPMAQALMQYLLTYEPPQGFYNPIPYGTELLSISVSGSRCYVDLSEKFVPADDTREAERRAVWTLVRSLTALEGITSVQLTVAGESSGLQFVDINDPLYGSWSLSA